MLDKDKVQKLRKKFISQSFSLSYWKPLYITHGRGQYLYDDKGKKYLDAINNIQHVGHSHPKLLEATISQLKKLNTNTRYLNDEIGKYAEKLISKMPKNLNTCFFTNSGSESNDLALRIAHNHTGSKETIVLDGAYHGHLISLIEISPYKFNGPGGAGVGKNVHVAPTPDIFRGKYRGDNACDQYVTEIKKIILNIHNSNKSISTFFSEAIMGCGGQIILPKRFLKKTYALVRKNSGLCIADEVQIGFGRTGSHFWGFETQNVVPDIITIGKSMGNGHPISACITTKEIANNFNNGMEYFNSFGGNPVSCAIGHSVLKIIEEEGLQNNALEVGNLLKKLLNQLKIIHPIIGDVRGKGLFLGIELVDDAVKLNPLPHVAEKIINKMKDKGILLSTDGPNNNVIKIKPPMVFNEQNAYFLTENLDLVLSNI